MPFKSALIQLHTLIQLYAYHCVNSTDYHVGKSQEISISLNTRTSPSHTNSHAVVEARASTRSFLSAV